jgi:hypothetical protein
MLLQAKVQMGQTMTQPQAWLELGWSMRRQAEAEPAVA